jgi:hypothetical protein
LSDQSPEIQLAGFIARYSPAIAARAQSILTRMRDKLPGAVELVYDNYNALAIGFGPTERASEVIFSIALYPRWVSLFFLQGASLPDPQNLLKGNGKVVRHIVIENSAMLDEPAIQELMARALEQADKPIDATAPRRILIKSVSAKQRPRRPGQKA